MELREPPFEREHARAARPWAERGLDDLRPEQSAALACTRVAASVVSSIRIEPGTAVGILPARLRTSRPSRNTRTRTAPARAGTSLGRSVSAPPTGATAGRLA